jgi:Tol biopolymer transport system component
MIAGRKAFDSASVAGIIASILERDPPPLASGGVAMSSLLDHFVSRCLAKNRAERWQTATDLKHELTWIAQSTLQAAPSAGLTSGASRIWKIAAYAASALAVLLAVGLAFVVTRPPLDARSARPRLPIRVPVFPPERSQFSSIQLAMSPDGSSVAYIVLSGNNRAVWVHSLTDGTSRALPGTDDAHFPFWSADGRDIAFTTNRGLMRVSAAGGHPESLGPAYRYSSGAWSEQGVILFVGRDQPGIFRVSARGGASTRVTALNASREELLHLHPRFLPGGQQFLYFARSRKPEYTGVYVRSLDKDDSRLLVPTLTNAEYSPPGYLLFIRDSVLFAQRFDLGRREVQGESFPVIQAVNMNSDNAGSGISVSADGSLGYCGHDPDSELKWLDRHGVQKSLGSPALYRSVEVSPDDRNILVQIRGTDVGFTADQWILDPAREVRSRLTIDARTRGARWSPDGQYVLFDSRRDSKSGIYRKRSDGSGPEQLVFLTDGALADVSRDGHLLITEDRACVAVDPMHEKKVSTFIESGSISSCGRFSPDGGFVAYTLGDSGRTEVYVAPFPAGARTQVSRDGGFQPQWRRDGRELFYLSSSGVLMSVTLTHDGTIHASAPREVLRTGTTTVGLVGESDEYTVSGDGQRWLFIETVPDAAAASLTVVTNWSETLGR